VTRRPKPTEPGAQGADGNYRDEGPKKGKRAEKSEPAGAGAKENGGKRRETKMKERQKKEKGKQRKADPERRMAQETTPGDGKEEGRESAGRQPEGKSKGPGKWRKGGQAGPMRGMAARGAWEKAHMKERNKKAQGRWKKRKGRAEKWNLERGQETGAATGPKREGVG